MTSYTRLLFTRLLMIVAVPLICSTNARASVFNPDGATHDDTQQSGWALPAIDGSSADYDNCLRCHQSGGSGSDKSSYVFGGHKNMSRPADGLKWGLPGVDATHPYSGDSEEASLEPDGSFSALWIQEDYPRMPVDWAAGPGSSTITLGYCAKDGTGAVGSDDVPDLVACPTCESPVMGNGNAGYPLNYPDSVACALAATDTGKPYTWVAPTTQPLYWIYGGAGLEGGPANIQRGSQQYKCGRCHTTGWTANHTADNVSAKHPHSDFPAVNFKTLTAVGSSTLLLRPSTAGDSATDVSSWDQWGIECSRCHVAKDGGHATWPTVATKGGDVVALCMNCHRTESDTSPRAVAGYNGTTTPIDHNAATPFTNKQQQPDGFAHHPDGPEFLNSPHAKFTGTFGAIGCPPYAINGYGSSITPYAPGAPTECTPGTMNLDGSTSSAYASTFARAAKVDLTGISDTAAGSCVTCHDIHKPLNPNTAGMNEGSTRECTECHANPSATVTPQVVLSVIRHPAGAGTPLENAAADPTSACEICHQPPGVKHLWRISTDPNYAMYGDYTYAYPVNGSSAAAAAKNVNLSHTAADGTYSNAMWIDLDNACGQCHGGGVSETDLTTTGSITAGGSGGFINPLTVANATGFASGKEVEIAGAGVGGADFKTIIAKVSGNTVYLTYPAVTSVSNAAVTVIGNPTANGAAYMTRAQLAAYAAGIHNDAPTITFGYKLGNPNTLTVNASAQAACSGGDCNVYDWNWGDGTPHGSGAGASHTYVAGGTYSITLGVGRNVIQGTSTKSVSVYAPDSAPTVGGACGIDANTWIATVTDTSTDDNGVRQVTVNWGDGSMLSSDSTAPFGPFTRTYANAGTYTITHKAIDTIGQSRSTTCSVSPAYFSIAGTVKNTLGTANLASANVTLKKSGVTVKTVYTSSTGTFTAGSLKPGTYTLEVTKSGYTFTVPAATITIGPSSAGNTINSLTP